MKHRYTIAELTHPADENYLNDLKLIRAIIADRKDSLTNIYSPLNIRLSNLYDKIDKLINHNVTQLPTV